MRQIIFAPLASIGSQNFVYDHKADRWTLDEDAVNRLFCATGNAGSTGIRIIPYNPWNEHPHGIKSQFQPYALNADCTAFNLGAFNDWYFPLVRRYIEIAKTYGQTTIFALLDNCQFAGDYKKWLPWSNNTQGIGTFYESKAWPFVKTWFEKCLVEFDGLGITWSWGNECNKPAMVDLVKNALLPVVLAKGLDFKKLCYGATMERVEYKPKPDDWVPTPEQPRWDYYPGMAGTLDWLKKLVADTIGGVAGDKAKLAIWKEVHSIGGKGYPDHGNPYEQAMYWWARPENNGIRILLSNDGVFDGDSLCDIAVDPGHPTGRRPSAERMAEIVKDSLQYKNDMIYEHLPKTRDIACVTATLRAMYKEMEGEEPEEKYHYDPPVPPDPPEPPPPPTPPAQKLNPWIVGAIIAAALAILVLVLL